MAEETTPQVLHVVPLQQYWYQKRWAQVLIVLFVVAVIALFVANTTMTALFQSSNASKIQDNINDINIKFDTMNTALTTNLNNITISVLDDRARLTVIEQRLGITPPPPVSTFIGAREKMTSPSYFQELNLFKSLSPNEQAEYLNLPKAGKIAKYGYTFQ